MVKVIHAVAAMALGPFASTALKPSSWAEANSEPGWVRVRHPFSTRLGSNSFVKGTETATRLADEQTTEDLSSEYCRPTAPGGPEDPPETDSPGSPLLIRSC